jgi:hypothetical protein
MNIVCNYGIGETYLSMCSAMSKGGCTLHMPERHHGLQIYFPELDVRLHGERFEVGDPRLDEMFGDCLLAHPVVRDGWAERFCAGEHFYESFRRLMGLDELVVRKPSVREEDIDEARKLFEEFGFREGKTVILFPGSISTPALSRDFWVWLVEELKGVGFDVCLNGHCDTELPIHRINMPLNKVGSAIVVGGHFISRRNGLCDFFQTLDVKKTIIYSDRKAGLKFFGLEGQWDEYVNFNLKSVRDSAYNNEVVLSDDNWYEKIEEIMIHHKGVIE